METKRLINATCPDCRGPMTDNVTTKGAESIHEYRCLVGHCYSAKGLLQAHSEAQEKALWSAVVALEEAINLVEAAASEFPPKLRESLREQAELKQQQAKKLRAILERLEPFQTG